MASTITTFIPGDIVVSISGDGDGSGTYTDNQASPITLEEINPTTGNVDGTLVLPQTSSTVTEPNGSTVTENAISGEYGSSSEGSLQLSADGHSLTIAGYGVNAATFNNGEANGNNDYGNAALAQSTSVQGTGVTAVPRVVADIGADGTVDTSTALYNIYNTQNPRSVVTTNGSSFYLSGQGVKGSGNQGVFLANDGSSTASTIYTGVDTRTAELYDGTLYVSSDSSQAKGTGNISSYGMSPTSKTTPAPLPGITGKITLTAAEENGANDGAVGTQVDLSPENFYFASPTTLYVADSGNPKGGTLGDGGLQKWTFDGSTWNLQYTLSAGLGIVSNTTTDPGQGKSATTGLIGLTGTTNANGTVTLYATNATVGDENTTGLYTITDDPTASAPATGEKFTELAAAPNTDSNIRGVAFAPTAAVCFVTGTLIRTTRGDIAVEALRVDDLAVTASGAHRPIRWIGHREVDCVSHAAKTDVWPVRVRAGAFGVGTCGGDLPARDLWLSPGHPVLVGSGPDEHLVPIMCLINGTTIDRVPVDRVIYWHIELDEHDILLAEGLPAESFLDFGNRPWFAEADQSIAADHALTNPDFIAPGLGARCRPVAVDGPVVDAARRHLDAVFSESLVVASAWPDANGWSIGF